MKSFDIVIIGSGILGVSLAYILSIFTRYKICVMEQEHTIAYHTSSRNSGKVHAPFIYHPEKKKLFAKSALLGFDMWEEYARSKSLPFKRDGVLEVALDDDDIDRLEEYMRWGEANGLNSNDLILLDRSDIKYIEPEVSCLKAIYCKRDASTNYRLLTNELAKDAARNGVVFLMNNKVNDISNTMINNELRYKFLINAAGGEAVDIAHKMGIAKEFTDIHFRGEYWKAPSIYERLTKTSIYSVPKFPEYPFLDPHWLVKVDGSCEVGPNALLVFSPYAYNNIDNLKAMIPKLFEMLDSARDILFDKQFLTLAKDELLSSLSKKVMINRVKRFLPKINANTFREKGIAGIRSVVIKDGKFVADPVIKLGEQSLHILNYNSPGATGSLPFSIYVMMLLKDQGIIGLNEKKNSYWNLEPIIEELA